MFSMRTAANTITFLDQVMEEMPFPSREFRPIAIYMAQNGDFNNGNAVIPVWLTELAPHVMMINPSVEMYMLDKIGAVIGHPPNSENLAKSQIDLQQIQAFLQPDRKLPITRDDPKHTSNQRIFSAFPLFVDNESTDESHIAVLFYAVVAGQHINALQRNERSFLCFDSQIEVIFCLSLEPSKKNVVFFAELLMGACQLDRQIKYSLRDVRHPPVIPPFSTDQIGRI